MKKQRLENCLRKFMHGLAEMNQEIFLSGDYHNFLSICTNDIAIIALLDKYPGETAKQLSVRMNLPKTTVVTAVSRLVKKEYVTREQNALDGREQLLRLTDMGKRVNMEHEQYEAQFIKGLMKLFREEDYEALADIFERSRV